MLHFYQTANAWIIGETPASFVPIAAYFMQSANNSTSEVNIIPVTENTKLPTYFGIEPTSVIKNANGDTYESVSDFLTAVAGYFATSVNPAYVKGNPFVYSDFTEEQLADLRAGSVELTDWITEETPASVYDEGAKVYNGTDNKIYTVVIVDGDKAWDAGVTPRWQDKYMWANNIYEYIQGELVMQ